ncbi:YgaP-like transmembrane domain [Negadavirga shengliensis]|uniref:YgaP-like transmembrane domain n=1 Tax=Negadavirga shengliensis TaxID=1389218 RepID=A0ABV9SUT9_9BACT
MDLQTNNIEGRVRKTTSEEANKEFDRRILDYIQRYRNMTASQISGRLLDLKEEWDIERVLEVNASSLMLAGVLMGKFVNNKWFALSGIVAGFLLQHGLQGWCPPLPLLRALGVRTRREIDEEVYALKVIRGDFDKITTNSPPELILETLRS